MHQADELEQAAIVWIRWFIVFQDNRHPAAMGAREINAFLTYLAVEDHVVASTQNQALSAVLFLYRQVLKQPLETPIIPTYTHQPKRLPVVLTQIEVKMLLQQVTGVHHLMAQLLYGAGLRFMECVRLRVKDLDLGYQQIVVGDREGNKDCVTMPPASVIARLQVHVLDLKQRHDRDVQEGFGAVYLPYAVEAV